MSQVLATSVPPPPFLRKTYELVEDPCTDPVISWNETGSAFVVWKSGEFARDLLPIYFKHNNFSSFVRQLNTYGFRKVVPERWEFSHDGFKRGEIKALGEIRRRRSIQVIPPQITLAEKSNLGPSSHSNSISNMKSTSTTPLNVKDNVVEQTAEVILWDENEKLRKDNERLNSELSCKKRQCEDLMVFFSNQVKVAPELINELILQGVCGRTSDNKPIASCERLVCVNHDNDNKQVVNKKENQNDEKLNLKLFGVWLKVEKREADDNSSVNQALKKLKIVKDYTVPWMKISSGESNRVCN